jgi:NAD(P)-dependent dehydrogenase (short-subunit alcohol dehydrogenase family)
MTTTRAAADVRATGGALSGRTALITGGIGAIGRAVARRFAAEGARVVITDRDAAACSRFAADIAGEFATDAMGIAFDITDPDDVQRAADEIESAFGVCDALVLNAGILILKPALELTAAEWSAVISVNLTGSFHCAAAFGRRMVQSGGGGTIVFSSSLFGVRGGRGNAAYSASKFGIIGLAQSLAAELAGNGIRVNAVCPGQIGSVMLDDLFARRAAEAGTTPEQEKSAFTARIPAGALGSVDDVAKAFVYLSSDQSSYVTGQHLVLDGGWLVG